MSRDVRQRAPSHQLRTTPWVAVASGAVCSALMFTIMIGCSGLRQKIVSTLLEEPETAPPPLRKVRTDLSQEIETLNRKLADLEAATAGRPATRGTAEQQAQPPVERAKTWDEAVALLPKTADGEVDWSQAIKTGAIAPRSGPNPSAPAEAVLSFDVVRIPTAGGEEAMVVFPHRAHTVWLACSSCHPTPFQMRKGATSMSMDQINRREGCGVCHGTVAFPATACGRCHPAMGG